MHAQIRIQFASLTGLLLVLQLPDALEALLATGKSKDIPSLFKRYLSTILHVMSWYEDDIFDPETKGYKSIRQVRSMHKNIQSLMNIRFKVPNFNGKERLWLTQFDFCVTQFAFVGLALLYPRKTAMIAASNEELELVNYYWRVLGHLMGVKDEFNCCQFDNYEDIREFLELIFQHEYLEQFEKHPSPMGLEMAKAICVALRHYIPLATFNSLAHWWSDCFSFNGYQLQPTTSKDKVILLITNLAFLRMNKSKRFLSLTNILQKRLFKSRLLEREKVYEKLKERYESNPQFYSDRFNYFSTEQKNETTEMMEKPITGKGEQQVPPLCAAFGGECPFAHTFAMAKPLNSEPPIVST